MLVKSWPSKSPVKPDNRNAISEVNQRKLRDRSCKGLFNEEAIAERARGGHIDSLNRIEKDILAMMENGKLKWNGKLSHFKEETI